MAYRYIPILRWKLGEKKALKLVSEPIYKRACASHCFDGRHLRGQASDRKKRGNDSFLPFCGRISQPLGRAALLS